MVPKAQRTPLGDKDANVISLVDEDDVQASSAAIQTEETRLGEENAQPKTGKKPKAAATATKQKPAAADKNKNLLQETLEIQLDGEESGDVPIYDTCDEVRRKIRAFLRRKDHNITQAALLRALGQCRQDGNTPISANSFRMFMDQKGPRAGGASCVLYAGYVFFEKLRLKEGKPKSKARLQMEQTWGDRGAKLDNRYFTCHSSERLVQDRQGMIHFLPRGGMR